jgi:6,7-dimethyl-8-ribityllumazine synthase
VSEAGAGRLEVPEGCHVVAGRPSADLEVAVVASRFNAEVVQRLLDGAVAALEEHGIARSRITVLQVPGAFELPLACRRLAEAGGHGAVIALGCVIRGETPHFDYVCAEAARGITRASLDSGVPVAFGVLTTDDEEQARARVDKGAEAARTALEMADVFSQLRAAAGAATS